jgi:capsular exopolysaccharide synthesis family protein
MSTDENSPLPSETFADRVFTVHPSQVVAPAAASAWLPAAAAASPEAATRLSMAAILGAVRRRWVSIALGGIASAVALGLTAWFAVRPQYEASADLLLSPSAPHILGSAPGEGGGDDQRPNAFEIYRDTQQQLLKSNFVLTVALRDETVKSLPTVRLEDSRHNAVMWLGHQLHVGSPGKNTAILAVSMTQPNAAEAAALVNAVVHAYLRDCVGSEQILRQARLKQLDGLYAEKEIEARNKRSQLKEQADQFGVSASDTQAISWKEQNAAQTYSEYSKELETIRSDLRKARGMLSSKQKEVGQIGTIEIAEAEVMMLARDDPAYRDLMARKVWVEMMAKQSKGLVAPGGKRYVDKSGAELDIINAQLQEVNQQYGERVRALKRVEIERAIRQLENEAQALTEQEQAFQKEVEVQRKTAERIGRGSTEIEMLRQELKHLDQVFGSIADERERLRVEMDSASRVRIMASDQEHPAAIPEAEANWPMRLALALIGAVLGGCGCAAGIVFWDARFERIGDAEEVKKLGLPLLGSVPRIPAGVLRRLGSPSKRNQAWTMRLTEAVDRLAARLLRKAEMEGVRVILVSSASAGEGKTTLATQLAMSLARHRRRTVLIDFDLRRPALDGTFGLSLEPGVCEILRGTESVRPAALPTVVEHLAVLTAGRWDRQTLAALASGTAKTLLDQLRGEYDFVIVDSSPILPFADTRLVSQHVDAVILSVFRDVSQGPKVRAAYEILEAFGVQSVEAVVTGGQEHFYGKEADYQATPPAEQEPSVAAEEADDAPPSGTAE